MDHKEMRNSMMNAIDVNELMQEIQKIILKPSDYTLIESTQLFKRCLTALEILSRVAEDAPKD